MQLAQGSGLLAGRSVPPLPSPLRPVQHTRPVLLRGEALDREHQLQRSSVLRSSPILLLSSLGASSTAAHAYPAYAEVEEEEKSSSDDDTWQESGGVSPPTFITAPGRIVAIGDLHGDLAKTYMSLQMAGVIELDQNGDVVWTGGNTFVIQLGDVLDRGDDEIAILLLLRRLDTMAREKGGAVYMLNGNHESLNVCGDFRYVTQGAFSESASYFFGMRNANGTNRAQPTEVSWEDVVKARAALWLPGGAMAMELSKNPTVLVVNDTAFAHGGLLPSHVQYGLERMNSEVAAWMRRDTLGPDGGTAAHHPRHRSARGATPPGAAGEHYALPPFLAMGDSNSVMWHRSQSRERFPNPIDRFHVCRALGQALATVGANRLVVGHTPQMRGANCECDGKVWRIDVGMSSGVLGASAQIIEIQKNLEGETEVKILSGDEAMLGTIDEEAAIDF